jgi:alkylresorcinol/alkylpyrone synthase/polyketide synthase Type III
MTRTPGILSLATANPPRRYSQEQTYSLLATHSPFYNTARIQEIFMNSDIDYRHAYFDIESMKFNESSDELHERFYRGSMEIGAQAINNCLRDGGINRSEIDFIVVASCTGYLCPGLSSLLIKELNLRHDIQRADLLGMGCAGALPGLQRAYDFVKAYPDKKALLLTVEICSACYYLDESLETVVGNAICSDGAAAVVIGMTENTHLPKIIRFETHLEPSLIHSVGFERREGKLRIILSKDIRNIAGSLAKVLITNLLTHSNMKKEEIHHWILHSGGRKVIDNLQKEMELSGEQVRHSKFVLRNFGNMSSPTVLFVLNDVLTKARPQPGDTGIMLAMGPGLALEGALLQW